MRVYATIVDAKGREIVDGSTGPAWVRFETWIGEELIKIGPYRTADIAYNAGRSHAERRLWDVCWRN